MTLRLTAFDIRTPGMVDSTATITGSYFEVLDLQGLLASEVSVALYQAPTGGPVLATDGVGVLSLVVATQAADPSIALGGFIPHLITASIAAGLSVRGEPVPASSYGAQPDTAYITAILDSATTAAGLAAFSALQVDAFIAALFS